MGKTDKKKWEKPKCIVLTKGDTGEKVLQSCKGDVTSSPASADGACWYIFTVECEPCSTIVTS